jgi:hypothetical protein
MILKIQDMDLRLGKEINFRFMEEEMGEEGWEAIQVEEVGAQ